ncbi:DinI family protein [Salmonella enterica subsp. houtenae]|uniref:Virulence protein MsgA n=1 Tax=Salmonella enterica subsp. enterica serovar Macclesfield str. S-1643 TaxID=1242107 RepID=A0A2C9NW51_SALET|nr:DinI-like family protein [Salmonella enterica]EAA5484749.1 DinI family protein [Salmonella enterica subsp. enterica serovar Kouka]EBX1465209.1 DinI family protein [Salmonella enterica subsp. salamae serovar Sofia]ECC3815949.1 DinI family protein [Salmonella enterica subsp. enterica]ECD9545969.1 DinI family protein [Salmonella enterica subsp. houtenae]ECI2499216.1 DinI family protein [Salmonella enterica subsp. enterica serovar Enteritidis]ECJ2393506.1 DinI family protein [Salmonella enteri
MSQHYGESQANDLSSEYSALATGLTKRVHRIFPYALVKVKPMQTNGLNSDTSKSDREKLNRMLEEMFEEADM